MARAPTSDPHEEDRSNGVGTEDADGAREEAWCHSPHVSWEQPLFYQTRLHFCLQAHSCILARRPPASGAELEAGERHLTAQCPPSLSL